MIRSGGLANVRRNAVVGVDTGGTSSPLLGSGIVLYRAAAGSVVHRNLVVHAFRGLELYGTSGAVVRRTTTLDSILVDCLDEAEDDDSNLGTDNTWLNNVGAVSIPAGICSPPAV